MFDSPSGALLDALYIPCIPCPLSQSSLSPTTLSFTHSHCEPHPHSQTQHTQLHHSQLMILATLPSHIQSSHDNWLMEWSLIESICVDMRDFGSSLIPVPLMIFVFAHRLWTTITVWHQLRPLKKAFNESDKNVSNRKCKKNKKI